MICNGIERYSQSPSPRLGPLLAHFSPSVTKRATTSPLLELSRDLTSFRSPVYHRTRYDTLPPTDTFASRYSVFLQCLFRCVCLVTLESPVARSARSVSCKLLFFSFFSFSIVNAEMARPPSHAHQVLPWHLQCPRSRPPEAVQLTLILPCLHQHVSNSFAMP